MTRTSKPVASIAAVIAFFAGPVAMLYCGRPGRAAIIFVAYWLVGLAGVACALYLPSDVIGVIALYALTIGWHFSIVVYSALLANRQPRTQTKPYQRVVWLIAACIAWVGCKYAGARVIRATTVEAFVMPTDSMSKTILIGDYLLGEKVTYHFRSVRRGDVVIFESLESAQTSIVKRVIALPGETIEVRDNVVHINGQPLAEPYAHFAGNPPNRQRLVDFGPVTVPDGEVFMMGDNRWRSHDSRTYGAVPIAAIRAKASTIYWSAVYDAQPAPRSQERSLRIRWDRIGRRLR